MKKIDLEKVRELASNGLTNEQIISYLGISRATFYARKKGSKSFNDALEKGKAEGMCFVANALMEQIKNGNLTAMIFYLKAHGWNEHAKEEEKFQVPDEEYLDRLFNAGVEQAKERQRKVDIERGFLKEGEPLDW